MIAKTPQVGINSTSDDWFKIKIDRKILKELSRRSDYEGWKHVVIYFVSLSSLGLLCYSSWGTWWFVPIYLTYCTLWGGADAIWHECGHRTAFKTRYLNDFFYQIASFMNNFESIRFHWSHSLHHSYTASVDPHDFEVEGSIFWKPKSLLEFLIIFTPGFGLLNLHKSLHYEILQHALGVETKVMRECIPKDKKASCIRNSRIYVTLWVAILFFAAIVGSWLPVMLLLVPKFFATLNIVWGITQHIGLKEDVKDHRLSTRSIRLNPIFSFIYWNMEYHVEHHMFPMVPSHKLPELHEIIKDELPKPNSLLGAYKEILPAIIKQTKDPNYYIPVTLPNTRETKVVLH
ncbi:MAG: stearoyl-CoA 9-desaturase [Crocinitomicaceae bacterium]|nr:stearoyl-CoA 9-desaturase [Crocinitomicaceae bacterium]